MIELIETIVIYKLSHLTQEEIQTMLQISDFRETRVYQDGRKVGLEEGIEKGIEKGIKKGIKKGRKEGIEKGRKEGMLKAVAILRLADKKKTAAESAAALKLDVQLVRRVLAQVERG